MTPNANYLIEYRFQGSSKYDIRRMILHLTNKFHLHYAQPKRPVPHITLAGGFTTNDEKQLVKDFASHCAATPLCGFTVNGFGYFHDSRVVFIDINPSDKLKQFRWDLAQRLQRHCNLKSYDYQEEFAFHATLALHLGASDFIKVKRYIDSQPKPKYKHYLLRATLLRNGKILYEYDFLQRRLLSRNEALDKRELSHTFQLLDDFFKGNYDPNVGLKPEGHAIEQSIRAQKEEKHNIIQTFFSYIKSSLGKL
jgi:2'-5' RNA ligase